MISDADLIAYIRPSTTDDLPTLRRLERAAVAMCQVRTGRYLGIAGSVTEYLHWKGWPMSLSNEPAVGVLTSFQQWDGSAFTAVDAGSYYLDGQFIYINRGTSSWMPLTMPTRYKVTYDAGYALSTEPLQLEDGSFVLLEDGSYLLVVTDANAWDAPEDIKQAVLLLVGHWFENREAVVVGSSQSEVPLAVTALLDGHIRVAV